MLPALSGQDTGSDEPKSFGVLGDKVVKVTGVVVHPEPVTVTTVPTGPEFGENTTVGAPETRGCAFNSAKTTTDSNASVSTSDSFLRLLVNSRILQYLCNTQREVT